MSKRVVCLVAMLGVLAGAACVVPRPAAAAAPSPPAWTIAIYDNADGDLWSDWAEYTAPWLRRLAASDKVNVVVALDRPGHTGTRLIKCSGRHITTVANFPEKDFGSPSALAWFLRLVRQRYPSQHVLLSLCDHGYGWRYASWDDTPDDALTMPELQTALTSAGLPIDVLVFDACMMADIDVAHQVARTGLVSYLVASEEWVEDDGQPYGVQLAPLLADPTRTPADVARDLVRGYARYYGPLRVYNGVTDSAVNVPAVAAMRPDLKRWVAALKEGLPLYRACFTRDLRASQYAWDSWYVDLGDVCRRLASDPAISDVGLKALSATVADDLAGSVLLMSNGSQRAQFSGLTLWWGTGSDWLTYRSAYERQVAFGRDVGWASFLRAYNAGATAAGTPAVKFHDACGLADVAFADSMHGWAVGYDNRTFLPVILRTIDGGVHWMDRSNPGWGNYLFQSVTALDSRTLWTCGDWGYADSMIMRSTNGGRRWSTQSSGTRRYLLAVDAADGRHAWVGGVGGTMLRTTDGGAHWTSANAGRAAARAGDDVWSVDFTSDSDGWIAGGDTATRSGFIRHTTDGGSTWSEQTTVDGAVMYSVRMASDEVGYAVGGDEIDGAGVVLTTTDGGASWKHETVGVPADRRLSDVTVAGPGDVWVTGDHGTLLHSTDGGASWRAVYLGTTADLFAASFPTATEGWVVGDCEQLFHTTDGGTTWSAVLADVTGPVTRVRPATARSGGRYVASFRADDGRSETATVKLAVTRLAVRRGGGLVPIEPVRVATIALGRLPTGRWLQVSLRAPRTPGVYRLSCFAADESGNPQVRAGRARLSVR